MTNGFQRSSESRYEAGKRERAAAFLEEIQVLILQVSNRYGGKAKRDAKGALLSGKGARHGIGLRSVRRIAEKYHGQMEVVEKGDVFCVEVMAYC